MKIIVTILIIIITFSPVIADSVGNVGDNEGRVVYTPPPSTITQNVNSSEYWDNLDDPSDINLNDLGDVNAGSPSDNDVLTWDDGTSKWIAESISGLSDIYVNESGDTMTGDLNMNGNRLTDVGELIMQGIITSQDIIPITTNLYSLGNSTNWYKEIYAKTINSENVTTDYLDSTQIDSKNITTVNLNSEEGEDIIIRIR